MKLEVVNKWLVPDQIFLEALRAFDLMTNQVNIPVNY